MQAGLGKFSFGLIVIFFGLMILLERLGVLDFSWSAALYYWPVLIILVGVNVALPANRWGRITSLGVTLVLLGFLAYQGIYSEEKYSRSFSRISPSLPQDSVSRLYADYTAEIQRSYLKISGGAISFELADTTDKLVDIHTYGIADSYGFSSSVNADRADLAFQQKKGASIKGRGLSSKNRAVFALNPSPVWEVDVELGAGAADLDLSAFKVKKVRIKGGVSSVDLKLGMPVDGHSQIDYEGGVSSLSISIPKAAGCRIEAESALSSLNFPGFDKQQDGVFISRGYQEATLFFEIRLENGLSSVQVHRYD